MEWVETSAKTMADAREAALDQLGVDESDAEFVVVSEPRPGLFGRVRGEARVRARVVPAQPRSKRTRNSRGRDDRNRRRERSGGSPAGGTSSGETGDDGGDRPDPSDDVTAPGPVSAGSPKDRSSGSRSSPPRGGTAKAGDRGNSADLGRGRGAGSNGSGAKAKTAGATVGSDDVGTDGTSGHTADDEEVDGPPQGGSTGETSGSSDSASGIGSPAAGRRRRGGRGRGGSGSSAGSGSTGDPSQGSSNDRSGSSEKRSPKEELVGEVLTLEEQGETAKRFVEGLLREFQLDGSVAARILDGETAEVSVQGENLGLLVGPGGKTLAALQEVTRTYVQRHTAGRSERILVDVADYRARRSAALRRFTEQVAAEVIESGVARALERMAPADRKVVHDTANDIEGISTRSEGVEPGRYVVLVPDSGTGLNGSADAAAVDGVPSTTDTSGAAQDDSTESVGSDPARSQD